MTPGPYALGSPSKKDGLASQRCGVVGFAEGEAATRMRRVVKDQTRAPQEETRHIRETSWSEKTSGQDVGPRCVKLRVDQGRVPLEGHTGDRGLRSRGEVSSAGL